MERRNAWHWHVVILTTLSCSSFSNRILYAYFLGLDRKEAPYVSIPLNNVIELKPHAYGCHEKRYCLMRKEEMLNDGQDEPVTSMPVKNLTHPHYAPNDPVMNAPSC